MMTAHGINYIEKAPLIAQRLGKLSGIIAAYRTAVRLGPMYETGPDCVKTRILRFAGTTGFREADLMP
jgi:hypothetical protein